MKILIAPDSFKGSLSALEFCEICKNTINSINPKIDCQTLPLADGGEGTLDALISCLDGKKIEYFVQDSLFDEIYVPIGFFDNGRSALIESAVSNGLPLIKGRENPMETSTYGVGQMIGFAVDYGAKNITLTLGGSSTNDCGLG
ncbi:MAG: glycerate kinase, partial [Treponema sp.]|nr:glycerate kinase [Treponema sp.]